MRIKYAVKIAAIKAAYTQLGVTTQPSISVTAGIFQAQRLSANVQTLNRILADAQEGNFIYFAKYFDTFYVKDGARPSDEMVFELFRYLADDSDVADLYIAEFNKIVGDSVGISDTEEFTKDFNRPLAEAPVVSELYASAFSKPRSDGFSVADDAARLHPNKVVFETTYFSDDIDTFDFGKFEQDTPAAAEQHFYALGKPLTDEFSLGETHFSAVGKTLEDGVHGAEDHVIIFAKKAADDTFFISQVLEKDFARPLANSYAVSDEPSLEPGKVLSDVVAGVGDQAFVFTKKVREDVFSVGDQINTFGFAKSLADTPLFGEAHRYDLSKPLSDVYSASDAPSLGPGKVLYDDVAGIGTYVFIFTKKAPDDTFAASDQINTFAVGKQFTDVSSAVDQIDTLAVGKALSDQPAAFDTITSFGTEKELQDSLFVTDDVDGEASILDDQEIQFVKQRTDTAFIGDSIYIQRVYIRDFSHTAAAADDALFSVGKTLSDTSGMSDSTNVVTGKHIYDIPVAAETLAFAFSSARADSALLGDVNEVAFNKTLLELTSTADAGSLRSQGYADFTYFGEDFVGASRTF